MIMNKNLRFLDMFDRNSNVYNLISELSDMAHKLLGADMSSGRTGKEDAFAEMVMDDKMSPVVESDEAVAPKAEGPDPS